MWKCPLADCTNTGEARFAREVEATATQTLNDAGEVLAAEYTDHAEGRRSHVRCAECGARAEWIDGRQVEMFPVAPTLEV